MMSTTAEFFSAIQDGDLARVNAFLAEAPTLAGACNEAGISAVLWAAYHGRAPVVERVVAADPSLNVFEAAAVGDISRVRARLEENPSLVHAQSTDGFFPLGLAAFFGHLEVLTFLLSCGADPNAASRNPMQVTPLHSAAAHREPEVSLRMAEALLRGGADPNVKQQGGWTPLHQAAAHGRGALLELLLSHGADADARSADGQTPEQKATEGGYADVAQRLRRQITAELP